MIAMKTVGDTTVVEVLAYMRARKLAIQVGLDGRVYLMGGDRGNDPPYFDDLQDALRYVTKCAWYAGARERGELGA